MQDAHVFKAKSSFCLCIQWQKTKFSFKLVLKQIEKMRVMFQPNFQLKTGETRKLFGKTVITLKSIFHFQNSPFSSRSTNAKINSLTEFSLSWKMGKNSAKSIMKNMQISHFASTFMYKTIRISARSFSINSIQKTWRLRYIDTKM